MSDDEKLIVEACTNCKNYIHGCAPGIVHKAKIIAANLEILRGRNEWASKSSDSTALSLTPGLFRSSGVE
jgi:hypothetical protein